MSKYSSEFKMEAVKRVETSNLPIARVAVELGVNENTLHGWIKRYKKKEDNPFPGSGKLSTEDAHLKKLEKENRELREELEILKKGGCVLRQESEIKRFQFISKYRHKYRVAKLCKVLEVSRSGYYAWEKRPKSNRELENQQLTVTIKALHRKSRQSSGSRKITQELRRKTLVNHKRVERIMRQEGLKSKLAKKFKATTNSNHKLPVAENILNREFSATRPNEKLVSDITYVWTGEGWLYVAAIMDLYGQKIIGLSMSHRMTKELVIDAFNNACNRYGTTLGCILHSDRGSQYCSNEYQRLLKKRNFICSMSRKGNCWDNAPMEAFWGKMKYEWLIDYQFRTRAEAKSVIFEYVEIFYNRQRLHASNDYLTPDEYYSRKMAA